MHRRSFTTHRPRRLVLGSAGLACAVLAGLALPGVASAASSPRPPTFVIDGPTGVANDGAASHGEMIIDNKPRDSGTYPEPGFTDLQMDVTVTGISTLRASSVDLSIASGPPVPLTGTGTLHGVTGSFFGPFGPRSAAATAYALAVDDPAATGTLTMTVILRQVDDDPSDGTNAPESLATATLTTRVQAPAAPVFTTADPPAATIDQDYSYRLQVRGAPSPTFSAVDKTTGASAPVVGFAPFPHLDAVRLNDGLQLDTTTGEIYVPPDSGPTQPDLNPDTYTITATNSQGSSTVDVTIPVLFSDVPAANPFSGPIYILAGGYSRNHGDPVIAGYGDGTFRPGLDVTRQAFVEFLARTLGEAGGPCSGGQSGQASPFSDVPASSPFCGSIVNLVGDGIISGYPDGTFHPASPVTRQAIAAYLYRADVWLHAGDVANVGNAPATDTQFSDVTAANPFSGDIKWLADNNITNGYPDGTFRPVANTSRQAAAAFLDRWGLLQSPGFWLPVS